MTTSNSTNFSQTRNEVILDALSLIGCNSIGKDPSASDLDVCNRFLNKMIKAWQTSGLHMWTKTEGILFLEPYVGQYDLGLLTTRFAVRDSVVTTTLTNTAIVGATTINVTNSVGMVPNSAIGLVGNNGVIGWYTIQSIPSSTSVILTTPVSVSVNSTQLVYSYSQQAGKPLRMLDARTLMGIDNGPLGTSLTSTPLALVPYQNYWNIGMTSAASTIPNQGTFLPKDLEGRFYIWPKPINGDKRIQITYERMIDDMDTARDSFDFPSEWLRPLTFNLAVDVCTIFGKEQKGATLAGRASMMLQELLDWDVEVTSISFQPDLEPNGGGPSGGTTGWGRK